MAKSDEKRNIYWFSELGIGDVPAVGGKNASLGEMFANLTGKGVMVPDGYAVSAYAYDDYVESSGVKSQIKSILEGLEVQNTSDLESRGQKIRDLINGTPLPGGLSKDITAAYDELSKRYGMEVDTAVRSSATAEDLPDASFAGQQDTYLNVRGHDMLLESCRACFASLFTARAIYYREINDFDHFSVSLSIAVQKMVRSDLAAAGVMFSIDTESGFKDVVYITSGYGLGENVVGGEINPDEWYVHKPTLKEGKKSIIYAHLDDKQQKMIYTDTGTHGKGTANVPVPVEEQEKFSLDEEEVLKLAQWATIIEDHYSEEAGYYKPMDMEWAKDGQTGDLFIVQARPETVVSRRDTGVIKRIVLEKTGPVLAEGMAVGEYIGTGKAAVIKSTENIKDFKEGMVLVTEMTDPDWVPIMKIASAIVTDTGGRTCHAAIISREMGIPCVVGTGNASKNVTDGEEITVSCAGGAKGIIYKGILPYKEQEFRLADLKMPSLPLYFHLSDPDRAFPDARYPNAGVGLLRIDEVIRDEVKVHPKACLEYPDEDPQAIDAVSTGYPDKKEYFVTKLAQSVARVAAAVYPKPVRALLSDATSAEMRKLIGGSVHPHTDGNPMLGTRGAGRYTDFDYDEAFALELQALARVRNEMGLDNLSLILPACQTSREVDDLMEALSSNGLERGNGNLEMHLLCRTPAQMLTLDQFADSVDGFLFNVGDIARLAQGIDPVSILMADYFSETHPAALALVETGLDEAKRLGKPAGLVNMSSGVQGVRDFSAQPLMKKADYAVIRSDMVPDVREAFLDAEGK